jgi:transposase
MALTSRIAMAALLMATLVGLHPFLLKLYADSGYQGPDFQAAMKRLLSRVNVEIVKRSDCVKGFVVLPKRWLLERTFAWLNCCRRLAKDRERLNRSPRTCNSLQFALCYENYAFKHDVRGQTQKDAV